MAKSIVTEKIIILGLLFFFLGTINHYQLISHHTPPKIVLEHQVPSSISIPSVSLTVQVASGGIKNGQWILSDDKALYLPTSGKVGEGYNTIIYAHNTKNLFANLNQIKKGDLIFVKDNKGKEFAYRVFSVEKINPRDLGALYSDEENIVTLFTCDGWFDSERLLVKARLTPYNLSK